MMENVELKKPRRRRSFTAGQDHGVTWVCMGGPRVCYWLALACRAASARSCTRA